MGRSTSTPYRNTFERVHVSPEQLDRPAGASARALARALLDEAIVRRDRLVANPTPADIHDFRVALRRFRSWLRAFDAELGADISRKTRRALRRAARSTGARRDLDVRLGWVRALEPRLGRRQKIGAEWLLADLETRRASADHRALHRAVGAFDRARNRLPLWESDGDRDQHAPVEEPTLGMAMARLLREHADALRAALEAVHTVDDDKTVHAARIAAKRLRYLLDPVAGCLPAGDAILEELKQLQDALGDAHDVAAFTDELAAATARAAGGHARQVALAVLAGADADARRRLRESDPVPGLLAIAQRLRTQAVRALGTVPAQATADIDSAISGWASMLSNPSTSARPS